ncbi:DUF6011 domain-containing protein [Virgibacillus sp. AGTR]|uniref:DUF6011 domain-containing protein n=1 Tax=Virgibacillus sp. AGTR TaxID=2812055 RepID=UPI00196672C0|nr:DUF6011 domain-containing protein [Virgibacillus sp. AGTR]MCC2250043.1 DUF6011 domain-containing protein [Virgibacillus sp. AGTR]QRZ17586.1 hypothetical protein JUJ52_17740 [Virgibacillus sp. AGTR]
MQHTECATCGRKLKDKKSIERGYGPVCYDKHLQAIEEEFERNQMTIYDVIEGEAYV